MMGIYVCHQLNLFESLHAQYMYLELLPTIRHNSIGVISRIAFDRNIFTKIL